MFISLLGGGECTLLHSSAWEHTLFRLNYLQNVPCQPAEFVVDVGM